MSDVENNESLDAVWIDVRTPEEHAARSIEGHANIPHEQIIDGVQALGLLMSQQIKLYCRTGRRSAVAASVLSEHGFTQVSNVGGFEAAMDEVADS